MQSDFRRRAGQVMGPGGCQALAPPLTSCPPAVLEETPQPQMFPTLPPAQGCALGMGCKERGQNFSLFRVF